MAFHEAHLPIRPRRHHQAMDPPFQWMQNKEILNHTDRPNTPAHATTASGGQKNKTPSLRRHRSPLQGTPNHQLALQHIHKVANMIDASATIPRAPRPPAPAAIVACLAIRAALRNRFCACHHMHRCKDPKITIGPNATHLSGNRRTPPEPLLQRAMTLDSVAASPPSHFVDVSKGCFHLSIITHWHWPSASFIWLGAVCLR